MLAGRTPGNTGALKRALSVRLEGSNPRKRGRPPGRRRTHTTINEHCQVYTESLSPFKRQRELSASASDQIGSPPSPSVDHEHSLYSPFEDTHVRQPDNNGELLGSLSMNFIAEADTRQLIDHAQYAGQLSSFLGSNFPPVICAEASERQSCFCLPHWNQSQGKLDLQAFHLPGVRMATFQDGKHLTWWCDCTYSLESARNIFANKDFPDR